MTSLDRRTAAWLFVACTCLYALSAGGHLYAADDQQKFATLDALLTRGTFAIEEGWAQGVGGLRYSWFPLGAVLLMLPGWLLGHAAAWLVPALPAQEAARAAIAFQNAAISAALVALMFAAARMLGFSARRALLAAVALAVGTMAWPYAKTAWTEPAAAASSPVSADSSVDLPLPDGPSTATMLPRGTDRLMSRSTVRPPRSRRSWSMRTMGEVSVMPESVRGGSSLARAKRGQGCPCGAEQEMARIVAEPERRQACGGWWFRTRVIRGRPSLL